MISFIKTYKVPLIIAAVVIVVLLYLHYHNKAKDAKEKAPGRGGGGSTGRKPSNQGTHTTVTDNATQNTSDQPAVGDPDYIPPLVRNPNYVAPGTQGNPLYDNVNSLDAILDPGNLGGTVQ